MPEEVERRVLIVALSARALAVSARAAGWRPLAIDCFADLDLREAAEEWLQVPVTADWRFPECALLAAANRIAPDLVPLVYGSGFERAAGLLGRLARGRPLLGTGPAWLESAKQPLRFAEACRRLALPHPETRLEPPTDPEGWLRKRRGGSGGGHVQPARLPSKGLENGFYYQRRVAGRPVSVLVVGDGRRARALGTAAQRMAPGRGFRFSGCVVPAGLPDNVVGRLTDAAEAIAAAFHLRGLGSVDMLWQNDGNFWVLELNPRPTACLDAYERAHDRSLFAIHVEACRGHLGELPPLRRHAASEILFAEQAVRIPERFDWPAACRDRSPPGSVIPRHGPICTLVVDGGDRRALFDRMREARDELFRKLRDRNCCRESEA